MLKYPLVLRFKEIELANHNIAIVVALFPLQGQSASPFARARATPSFN